MNKSQAIRLAERRANESGETHVVIKVCLPQGYDIMTEKDFNDSDKKAIYTAVSRFDRNPDMELG